MDLSTDRRKVDPSVFIADTATLIGDVTIGCHSSVWFGVVMRGDVAPITVGAGCNIQDGAIVHADAGFPTTIGHRVTLGHGAVVHGATIEDDVLIGIRAVVLNGAVIGRNSIVGAGTVVTEGMVIPPGSLVLGVPAQVVRRINREQEGMIRQRAADYMEYARAYKEGWR
ncbi:MAG: gamma carbonic anhydrase family protein [Anaerolineae bacterium]